MDLYEVEKYRPIPRGGLKLLVALMMYVMISLGVAALNGWATFVLTSKVPDLAVSVSIGVGSTIVLFLLSLLGSRYPISWFRDYWRRNVWGYVLWCWRDDKGEVQWAIGQTALHELAIGLALGGWFRRSRITCPAVTFREGVNSKEMLSRWRVKLVEIHACTQTIIVRLKDWRGDRVTVNAKDALEILERFSARLEALDNLWDAIVRHGLIAERVRTEERDEAKLEILKLRGDLASVKSELENALVVIDKAIAAIKNTSRLGKSKEAQRIREGLIDGLVHSAPMGHPLRERYERYDGQRQAS